MKKKIFGGIAIVAIAIAVALNVNMTNKKMDNTSLLALANIEALADGESSTSYDCPGGRVECLRIVENHTTHIFYKQ